MWKGQGRGIEGQDIELRYAAVASRNSQMPRKQEAPRTSSFLICVPLSFFSCLVTLAKTSSTMVSRYGRSGQPYLVFDFSGIYLSFYLSWCYLYYVEIDPCLLS